jgi:hypothetical protein
MPTLIIDAPKRTWTKLRDITAVSISTLNLPTVTDGLMSYIGMNSILMWMETLRIDNFRIEEFAKQFSSIKIIKEPFCMIYVSKIDGSLSMFIPLIPEEKQTNENRVRVLNARSRFMLKVLAGTLIECSIMTDHTVQYTTTFSLNSMNTYGGHMFSTLYNSHEWVDYEKLMTVDEYMVIRRATWNNHYRGDLLNLLDPDGNWYDVLGLYAISL